MSTVWGISELDSRRPDRDFNALVSRTVPLLSVEFLYTNGVKPHVVFNVKANDPPGDPRPHFKGCRLSMEWSGDEHDSGDFEIRALPYIESSRKAYAAFDFQLHNGNLTIRDWCNIIRGRHPGLPREHTSDLTRFRFVVAPGGKMDGCRDFICQSFMRFYQIGVVRGHGAGLGTSQSFENFALIPRHPELGSGDDYWFFDIIDKNFVKINEGTRQEKTRISVMPMHRGVFLANVTRIEIFRVLNTNHSFPLNYVQQAGAAPAGGNNGPPAPPGAGGAGGKPPTGKPPGPGGKPPGQPPSNTGAPRPTGNTGPAGGAPPGNQMGRRPAAPPVAARPTPTTPGMGLAPVKKQTPAALPTRTKVPPVAPPAVKKATPVAPPAVKKATPVAPPAAKKATPVVAPAKKATPVAAPALKKKTRP